MSLNETIKRTITLIDNLKIKDGQSNDKYSKNKTTGQRDSKMNLRDKLARIPDSQAHVINPIMQIGKPIENKIKEISEYIKSKNLIP